MVPRSHGGSFRRPPLAYGGSFRQQPAGPCEPVGLAAQGMSDTGGLHRASLTSPVLNRAGTLPDSIQSLQVLPGAIDELGAPSAVLS
eukprot:CAMPEP_0185558534 /NCGR_PEP_ID=MMETSP1381-20130426/52496_1 /TAXON_ID=298111 /ORGANISM="Pavlova sp., Strain CCMP459" /LENGTH=86 /DNA_ID=CAMNT_0028172091 /DNA_START=35 /DNA_END=291 /DNA_ORIENTATION=+